MIDQIKKQISEIEKMLEVAGVGTELHEELGAACNALYDVESVLEKKAPIKCSNNHHDAWVD